jgi:hypothetical protein
MLVSAAVNFSRKHRPMSGNSDARRALDILCAT